MFWVLKGTVSEKKDAKTFCYHLLLLKVLPTSDQFYSTMFDNLYVKHNLSNLENGNSLKY